MNQKQKIIICKTSKTSCPPTGQDVKFLHPRIYLELKDGITSTCPYCGLNYTKEPYEKS